MTEAAPRVFIQDVMGASKPESLADLNGPRSGMLTLPLELFWGPHNSSQLDDLDHTAELYQAVIRIGTPVEQAAHLNAELLRLLWKDLMLPRRNRDLWEAAFPELRSS